jgi:DMSO/TMAO reductase YedYZ molybdopterin-dependent catalytic subunit
VSEDKRALVEKVREFEARTGHTLDSYPADPQNTASLIGERRHVSEPLDEEEAERRMFLRSRRSFLMASAAAVAGILGWSWLGDEAKANLYRRAFEFNERVSRIFFRPTQMAREFSPDKVVPIRTNGMEGLEGEVDPSAWRLAVRGLAGRVDDLLLNLDDIKRLPRTEMITELKCIEGWSTVIHWAGVRFCDFAAAYPPKTQSGAPPDLAKNPDDLLPYVDIRTPDEKYFVGWDMPSILHPQTLLAYEMNGAPLRPENGAPLRIASPTKYGIKQLKRIGRIEYTLERPRDFWAEYGYDWYSGH